MVMYYDDDDGDGGDDDDSDRYVDDDYCLADNDFHNNDLQLICNISTLSTFMYI